MLRVFIHITPHAENRQVGVFLAGSAASATTQAAEIITQYPQFRIVIQTMINGLSLCMSIVVLVVYDL
jgi:UDP-N-acetyl-D-mannosaminuronic acid transferase (WecB/TagA/CpsF family)